MGGTEVIAWKKRSEEKASYEDHGGNRWVLRRERKRSSDDEVRMEKGREFQMVGATKEKERRPISEFILRTLSSF